jgi:hypothetical protein
MGTLGTIRLWTVEKALRSCLIPAGMLRSAVGERLLKVCASVSGFWLTRGRVLNMVYLPVGVRRQYPDGEANRPQRAYLDLTQMI